MGQTDGTVTLVGPNGEPLETAHVPLTSEEAELLRKYKKFLEHRGLREALFCNNCWNGNRQDGCEAYVTVNEIAIKCRCAVRMFRGLTF